MGCGGRGLSCAVRDRQAKTTATIVGKLRRSPTGPLSPIQDLAGFRIVGGLTLLAVASGHRHGHQRRRLTARMSGRLLRLTVPAARRLLPGTDGCAPSLHAMTLNVLPTALPQATRRFGPYPVGAAGLTGMPGRLGRPLVA
jgi:hypothetical protein